jgi:hypothetical protein
MTIDILPAREATKYLGRQLGFNDPHRIEIENRIRQAWRKFYYLKQELTGRRYPLTDRLRLFHGTVTPTILYGCEAWTMTGELENRLRRTQRQMLRMILHAPRRLTNTRHNEHDHVNTETPHQGTDPPPQHPTTTATTTTTANEVADTDDDDDDDDDVNSTTSTPHQPDHNEPIDDNHEDLEPWADWIRRCTHDVEARMRRLKLDDWITMQRRRKWRWARKVATTQRCDWMAMAIRWDPTCNPRLHARRRQGRPKTRWTTDIVAYLSSYATTADEDNSPTMTVDNQLWLQLAQDELSWTSMEEGFCQR